MADRKRDWKLVAGQKLNCHEIKLEIDRRRSMQKHWQLARLLLLQRAMEGSGNGEKADIGEPSSEHGNSGDSIVFGRESQVYECLDPENIRRAVKCIDYDGTKSEILESYLNEVKLLMELDNCRRVIHVLGAENVVEDKMLYAVMKRGEIDLEQLLQTGRVDKLTRKFYWKEMLLAVEQLHKKGIVHADLKPANFVLVEGTLKIIDLGLSKMMKRDSACVTCDSEAGTVDFISPEAFVEGPEDNKIRIGPFSDVWSLGVILYALLYGVTPFQHLPDRMQKLIVIASPRKKIEFKPVILEDIVVIDSVKRCLQRDFNKRATITELLNHQYLSATGSIKLTEDLVGLVAK